MRVCGQLVRALLIALAVLLVAPSPVDAARGSVRRGRVVTKAKARKVVKRGKRGRRAKRRKSRRRRRRGRLFRGHAVFNGALQQGRLSKPSGWIHLYSVNYHDEIKVNIFNEDGSYNEEALVKLNYFMRSRRTGTERVFEPRLVEVLSHIYDHYEGRVIEFISGYRNQPQAESYHYLASAIDLKVRGVSVRGLRDYVKTLDTGGMGLGYYPRVQFIHVDIRPEPSYRWLDRSGRSRRRRARRVPRS